MSTSNQRLNELLLEYWQSLRKGRPMPLESDVSPADIAGLWPHCFLVHAEKDTFRYDYLGTALVEAYGDDLTGHEICETLLFPHPDSLFATFQNVKNSGEPALDEGEFTNHRGFVIKYRSVVLPLGHRSEAGVRFLFGGMRWKAY